MLHEVLSAIPHHVSSTNDRTMYNTQGIEAIATITELRSKTSELVEHAKKLEKGVLIQKNNEPYAVLVSFELYSELVGSDAEERNNGKQ
jgi:prevent-host-death family protein